MISFSALIPFAVHRSPPPRERMSQLVYPPTPDNNFGIFNAYCSYNKYIIILQIISRNHVRCLNFNIHQHWNKSLADGLPRVEGSPIFSDDEKSRLGSSVALIQGWIDFPHKETTFLFKHTSSVCWSCCNASWIVFLFRKSFLKFSAPIMSGHSFRCKQMKVKITWATFQLNHFLKKVQAHKYANRLLKAWCAREHHLELKIHKLKRHLPIPTRIHLVKGIKAYNVNEWVHVHETKGLSKAHSRFIEKSEGEIVFNVNIRKQSVQPVCVCVCVPVMATEKSAAMMAFRNLPQALDKTSN